MGAQVRGPETRVGARVEPGEFPGIDNGDAPEPAGSETDHVWMIEVGSSTPIWEWDVPGLTESTPRV
ncbi:hypothetical protein [Halostreptopolyspora alba]|uniref:Uncharacterized protein n=1 Tax=Halostreptopolyspora alba TaxID=2487137 RepID=A0A3N0EAY0_9ACTN|nr:hypothetical protein EFW17_10065 [Nocardiopsaceae bacterium YIM 96095]